MAPAPVPALDEILALELRLQDPQVRGDAAAVESLLTPDFFEIGSSGILEDRTAILHRLAQEARAGTFVPPTLTTSASNISATSPSPQPRATAALARRAPSMWTYMPRRRASAAKRAACSAV